MEIRLAKTAGFCFGVERAVEAVYSEIEKGGKVYTYGPVIHNDHIIDELKARGVRILNSEKELLELKDKDATVIIRAHGVPEHIYNICEEKGLNIVDATCPFVKKIHKIVTQECKKFRQVIIVGNPDHPEVRGILGWGDEETRVIQSFEDFQALEIDKKKPISIVAQTTINYYLFQEVIDKISELGYDLCCFNTVCGSTQERQKEAAEIAASVDAMIVIGSKQSSNTEKLFEICRSKCKNSILIDSAEDIVADFCGANTIGITAGASTPKHIIEEVQNYVRNKF